MHVEVLHSIKGSSYHLNGSVVKGLSAQTYVDCTGEQVLMIRRQIDVLLPPPSPLPESLSLSASHMAADQIRYYYEPPGRVAFNC